VLKGDKNNLQIV